MSGSGVGEGRQLNCSEKDLILRPIRIGLPVSAYHPESHDKQLTET